MALSPCPRACLPLAVAALLAGCGGGRSDPVPVTQGATLPADAPAAVQKAFQDGTPVDPAIVTAGNGMGFSLFNQLRPGAGNLFVSPTSLALALGMTCNGAAGTTLSGMAQAMQVGALSPAQVNADNAALLASLLTADGDVTLTIASSIWAQNDVLPAFLATNQAYYGATLGPLAGAPATVNAWVNQMTRGNIPTILPAAFDPSKEDAVLVNAIYFHGAWTTPFPASATAAAPFNRADGSTVSVPMMHVTATAGFASSPQATVARLPYGNGRFAMVFLLPSSGGSLDALAASLTPAAWNALVQPFAQPLASSQVALAVPKFKATWTAPLNAPLIQMGMGAAFDPLRASFPALSTSQDFISSVVQSTTVEVDEAGTTATGATSITVTPTAVLPGFLTLDRPFLYAIQDTRTGELLFLGQMMDPTAG